MKVQAAYKTLSDPETKATYELEKKAAAAAETAAEKAREAERQRILDQAENASKVEKRRAWEEWKGERERQTLEKVPALENDKAKKDRVAEENKLALAHSLEFMKLQKQAKEHLERQEHELYMRSRKLEQESTDLKDLKKSRGLGGLRSTA